MADSFTFKVHDVHAQCIHFPQEPLVDHVRRVYLDENKQKLVRNGISHQDVQVMSKQYKCPNPFVQAVVLAFDKHLPLVLRPQHFWLCITQAIAMHVEANAEALKSRLVPGAGSGKKTLKLDVTVEAMRGFERQHWQEVVEERFPKLLRAETANGVVDALMGKFASSTAAERVAASMVVMDALKSFFDYKMMTMCGFPSITLEGSLEDWKALKEQAIAVVNAWTLKEFATWWLPILTPVLDRLVAARSGAPVDTEFWGSFVKRGCTHGSGSKSWISGWVNVFFPLQSPQVQNTFCEAYATGPEYVKKYESQKGLEECDFPTGLCSVPTELDGHPLEFRGGFLGVTVDKASCAVQPLVGWLVASGAPPSKKNYWGQPVPDVSAATAILTNVGAAIPLVDFYSKQ